MGVAVFGVPVLMMLTSMTVTGEYRAEWSARRSVHPGAVAVSGLCHAGGGEFGSLVYFAAVVAVVFVAAIVLVNRRDGGRANVGPMGRISLAISAVLTVAVVTAALSCCGREPKPQAAPPTTPAGVSAAAADFAAMMRQRVTVDAMMAHPTKLQEIADANDGNRALGTPGYDASVEYVADALRGRGFDVQTPEFEVRLPFAEEPVVTVGGAAIAAKPLEWTVGTPPQGVTGPLVAARVEDSSGCTASDYDGLPVAGAVVLVDRGQCQFSVQAAAAAERGAVAMIVANNVDGDEMGGTLGEDTDVKIPAVSVTKASGARLRAKPGETTLRLDAGVRTERTRNVIAQTKMGSTTDVVMLGAHLDSVAQGPGINDNGSGVGGGAGNRNSSWAARSLR